MMEDIEFRKQLEKIKKAVEVREQERVVALETIQEIKQLILNLREDIVRDLMQQIKQDLDTRIVSALKENT